MRKISVLLVILFVFCGTIFGAEGDVLWTRTYNDTDDGNDRGYGIAVDGDGNVYVTGYEFVTGESYNIWVRKYDSDGDEVWTKTHNGSADSNDEGYGITVDGSGNVYITGYETVTGESNNIWVRKYDTDGDVIWTKTYNGVANGADRGRGIAVDGSGNVYVIGREFVTGESHNIWVRKYDSGGDEVWTRTYNDVANSTDYGRGIAVDGDGNVYITGQEWVSGEGSNIWVRKYDSDGDVVWTRTHNGTANLGDEGHGIAVDSSGNVYVTAKERPTGGESDNIWVRKYDTDGDVVWTKTHNGPGSSFDEGQGIAVDGSGNVYVTGWERQNGEGYNIWVGKYDSDGNEVWTGTYNDAEDGTDNGYGIAVDGGGNVYVTGYESTTAELNNIWVRKYAGPFAITTATLPEAIFNCRYNESLSTSGGSSPISWTISSGSLPSDLSLTSDGIISGTLEETGNYSFTVSAVEKFGAPDEKSLSLRVKEMVESSGEVKIQGGESGYVNPKKGEKAKIHFKPSGSGTVKVKIYTLRGLLVWEGTKSVSGVQDFIEWNCRNKDNDVVASGIYAVYVEGPGIKATKKVAILK